MPEGVVIATKVDPSGRDYSADRVRASVAESRERLGIDQLPLVHLHDPESFDFAEMSAPGGPVEALVQLRDAGEVGAIGLAGGRVQEIAKYLDLGVFDVLLVHNRWTLVDRSAGPLLDEAVRQGMGILNAAVYGGGILAFQAGGPTTLRLPPGAARDAGRGRGDAPGVLRLPHRPGHRGAAVLAAGPADRVDHRRHEPPGPRRPHARPGLRAAAGRDLAGARGAAARRRRTILGATRDSVAG